MAIELLMKDIGGQYGNMLFPNCDSGAISDIETFIAIASSAGVIGANEISDFAVTSKNAASGADLDRKALLYGVGDTSGDRYTVVVPAPLFSGTLTDAGERVPASTGQGVMDDWGVMAGEGITFTSGIIVEKE